MASLVIAQGMSRPVLGPRAAALSEGEATAPSRVQHFRQAFLRLVRKAIETVAMTPPTAASYAGVTISELCRCSADQRAIHTMSSRVSGPSSMNSKPLAPSRRRRYCW